MPGTSKEPVLKHTAKLGLQHPVLFHMKKGLGKLIIQSDSQPLMDIAIRFQVVINYQVYELQKA